MKTNRVTYFVVLAISIMLLTAGFILYYSGIPGFGDLSLFFYTLGFAALIFSLFGLIFNKTMTKHFNLKTFGISIIPLSALVFTAFDAFVSYREVEFYYLLNSEKNPKLNLNLDFILNSEHLLNLFIISIVLIIFSITLLITTIFINIKIRKKQNLLKRGLFLDYALALPFGFFGAYCVFGLIILTNILFK